MTSDANPTSIRIEDLLTTPIPKQLWHYTSYGAMQKIIESKCIWATDLRYLNDHQEFTHAINICYKWAEKIEISGKYPNLLKGMMKSMVSEVFDMGSLHGDRRQTFVASFSMAKDQLSQWRAYSGASSGISISFDLSQFRLLTVANMPVVFAPCVYDDSEKEALLEQSFSPLIDVLNKKMEDLKEELSVNPALIEKSNTLLELNKNIEDPVLINRFIGVTAKIYLNLLSICGLLKHSKFVEEAEWRLVIPASPWGMPPRQSIEFRSTRDALVPYVAHPLPINENGSIFLNGVILGPGSHSEALAGISSFLQTNSLYASPRLSEVPYRPW